MAAENESGQERKPRAWDQRKSRKLGHRSGACRIGVIYAGTEPSAIFRSEDVGETWRECRGLIELPSAHEWSFPPRPETHHVRWIEPDPHTQGRLFAAIEAGALIRSPDAGV